MEWVSGTPLKVELGKVIYLNANDLFDKGDGEAIPFAHSWKQGDSSVTALDTKMSKTAGQTIVYEAAIPVNHDFVVFVNSKQANFSWSEINCQTILVGKEDMTMKKNRIFLLTAFLALAGLSGCNKNNDNKQLENDLAVTGATLNVTYASVEAGESITLEPTIHFKDDNPVECYTEWRSNNQKVATVSDNGVVLALKSGYAAITFIAGYKSASCSITVPSHDVTPVTPVDPDNPVIPGEFTISLNASNINLAEGSSFQLTATTRIAT